MTWPVENAIKIVSLENQKKSGYAAKAVADTWYGELVTRHVSLHSS